MDDVWDSLVIGGGAAGLSAALVLGRARRRVLVIDAGEQSNRFTHGIGGLLGHNEKPPAELYAAGRAEVLAHPTTQILDGVVSGATPIDGAADHASAGGAKAGPGSGRGAADLPPRFALTTAAGDALRARTVILATGMDYAYPQLPGFAERWGRSVFHCPFCHGWEVRGQPLAVLGDGPGAVHRALLLRAWSDNVTVYLASGDGSQPPADGLTPEQEAQLLAGGVQIERTPVLGVDGPGTSAAELQLADGSTRACGGVLIAITLRQRSPLAQQLGAQLAEPGMVARDAVAVDQRQTTSVPGLFAAGDVSTQMPQISSAVSTGVTAAAAAVGHLMAL